MIKSTKKYLNEVVRGRLRNGKVKLIFILIVQSKLTSSLAISLSVSALFLRYIRSVPLTLYGHASILFRERGRIGPAPTILKLDHRFKCKDR